MTLKLSIVIPTYNEAENVPVLVERVAAVLSAGGVDHELIVVDDDSPDGTWRVAESLRARFPQVRVIRRTSGERGLAPAVAEGWRAARGELLGVMDADLQHPPEVLVKLLEAFADPGVDLALASRYAPRGGSRGLNVIRKWLSRGASNLAQAVLPAAAHGVTDPMSGFFLLRRRVVEHVELRPQGYKILLEVLGRGRYHQVAEVPFEFGRRTRGESKLGAAVMRDYLRQLWQLAWAPTGFGRFVRFCLVGSTGVVVNMGMMWWLKGSGLLGTLRSGAVAVEAAILNNFLWNELWTFKDRSRQRPRLRDRLRRLWHFNLVCGVGAAFHLATLWTLAIRLGWNYLLVNGLAIGLVTFWNYGLNTTWTWTRLTQAGAPRPQPGETARAATWLVAALALGWLALQAWLAQVHWINPDEGAHLMDARLTMEGLIPEVDFHARQPLYVYAYVPFLALFGKGYAAGRLMPVLATALAAWVLFLLGRRLWGASVGLIAAALYLYSPTILINAAVVKTEPLAILLTCLSVYAATAHFHTGRWTPLYLSGAALGMGYYVRESTLAGVLAVAALAFFQLREGFWTFLRRIGLLLLGFMTVCGATLAHYSRYLTREQLLSSESLSPLNPILIRLQRIFGWLSVGAEGGGEPVRQSIQSWSVTAENLMEAVHLNVHLLAGTAIAAGWWVWRSTRRAGPGQERADRERWNALIPLTWLGSFVVLYSYHMTTRGFFQFYFREFIPPMALLLAVVLVALMRRAGWERHWVWVLPLCGLGCVGIFALQRAIQGGAGALGALLVTGGLGWLVFRPQLARPGRAWTYVLGFSCLLASFALVRFTGLVPWLRPLSSGAMVTLGSLSVPGLVWAITRRAPWARCTMFSLLAVIATMSIWTSSYAAGVLGPSYDCVWSPATVREVVGLVRNHTASTDEVLSGAVIWEFESGRRPFMNISHPLSFSDGMPDETAQAIRRRLAEQPPTIVVVDGFTQETYLVHLPELEEMLHGSYDLVREVQDSRWPVVRVYVRRPQLARGGRATGTAEAGSAGEGIGAGVPR